MKQLLFTIGLLLTPFTAQAYPHGWHDHWHDRSEWRRPVAYPAWHAGYWHHGYHENHFGWWWVSGGLWNFYATPVYPYPSEPTVIVQVPSPPPPAPPPPAPPAPVAVIPHLPTPGDNTLYYCAGSNAFFPYVVNCAEGWTLQQGTAARP